MPTRNAVDPAAERPESLRGRAWRLIRENRALVILLAAASVVRLLIMIAYQPAIWYFGDSGSYISQAFEPLRPQATGAVGYVPLLKILKHTHTLFSVSAVQHLMGMLMAVAIYALLRHRGVRPWLACLAVTPVLFDSLELLLEHTILVETFAMTLMVAAIVLLFWPSKPGPLVCVMAGLLMIGAWFVRPQFLPVILILVVYLGIRRVGWVPWVAFFLAVALPYLYVVEVFVGPRPTPYTTNYMTYYARVAPFARCDQLQLTDAERAICPAPEISGHKPDWYIWVPDSPAYPYHLDRANDPVLLQFAIDVVRQQPGDYLRAVGIETAAQFVDGVPLNAELGCVNDLYMFSPTYRLDGPGRPCRAQLASGDFQWPGRPHEESPPATALTTAIATYGQIVRTPRLAVLGVYVLVAAAVVTLIRRRRRERAHVATTAARPATDESRVLVRDAVTLAVVCLSIIVGPVVVFMYGPRYALPALPLIFMAGGMAVESMLMNRRRTA